MKNINISKKEKIMVYTALHTIRWNGSVKNHWIFKHLHSCTALYLSATSKWLWSHCVLLKYQDIDKLHWYDLCNYYLWNSLLFMEYRESLYFVIFSSVGKSWMRGSCIPGTLYVVNLKIVLKIFKPPLQKIVFSKRARDNFLKFWI